MFFTEETVAKKMILAVGRRMYEKGYVVNNDGNLSVKVAENKYWCTPTGVCKGDMTEEMLIKVDEAGNVLEGSYKPSSELKMHLRAYAENPNICAVVHAHPPVATAFACAGKALDEPILAEAVLKLGKVPLAPYATLGTSAVGDSIGLLCKDYSAILLENHGVVTFGKDLWEAYYLLETVEQYAKILLYTCIIGKKSYLSSEEIEKLRKG